MPGTAANENIPPIAVATTTTTITTTSTTTTTFTILGARGGSALRVEPPADRRIQVRPQGVRPGYLGMPLEGHAAQEGPGSAVHQQVPPPQERKPGEWTATVPESRGALLRMLDVVLLVTNIPLVLLPSPAREALIKAGTQERAAIGLTQDAFSTPPQGYYGELN